MAQHDWVKSTLGHGEQMCRRCFGTNRELAALGELYNCSATIPESTDMKELPDGVAKDH